jgi:hypothetical protein
MRPGKKGFDIHPYVLEKQSNVFKEKYNAQYPGDDHLDQVTAAAGVNIN